MEWSGREASPAVSINLCFIEQEGLLLAQSIIFDTMPPSLIQLQHEAEANKKTENIGSVAGASRVA
jgi:hypothetical protein